MGESFSLSAIFCPFGSLFCSFGSLFCSCVLSCLKSLVLQSNYRVLTLFVKVPLKSYY